MGGTWNNTIIPLSGVKHEPGAGFKTHLYSGQGYDKVRVGKSHITYYKHPLGLQALVTVRPRMYHAFPNFVFIVI